MSDALCRLASGGSFAVRQLYTDRDEVLFQAARPVILNGIENVLEPVSKVLESPESVVILSLAAESISGSCHVDQGSAHPAYAA
jgi:hypothetical protein